MGVVTVWLYLQENWRDNYVKLTTPTSLPELKERQQDFYDRLKSNEGSAICSM